MQRVNRAVMLLLLCAAVAHAEAVRIPVEPRLRRGIGPQDLNQALKQFAQQTGLQYFSYFEGKKQTRGAAAGTAPAEALGQLLKCTGLRFEFSTERSVNIVEGGTPADDDPDCGNALPVIVVRSTRLREQPSRIPANVTVRSGSELHESGIDGLSDLAFYTPGVELRFLSSVGASVYNNLSIRGIADRHGSTTAIFIDDIPIPHIRSNNLGLVWPSMFDLDSSAILRGPQGDLYGANTMGGAVVFVTKRPSLEKDESQDETQRAGIAQVEYLATEGADPGVELGFSTGGPIVEQRLGYQFSAWGHEVGGYVDRADPFNKVVVEADADRVTSRSMRGALSYSPVSGLVITPAIDYEYNEIRDSPSFMTYLSDPGSGKRWNGSLVPQPAHDGFYLPSLRVTYRFGKEELIGTTAYFDRSGSARIDDTESIKWGKWGGTDPRYPAPFPSSYDDAVITEVDLHQRMLFHDVILRSDDPDSRFDTMGGISFAREEYSEFDHVTGPRNFTGTGRLDATNLTNTLTTRLATFGQVEYRPFGKHYTMTAGLRIERSTYDSEAQPAFHVQHAETLTAPKFALYYKRDEDSLYYLSAAKGYSPAGVDAALPTCNTEPTPYPSDTVWSYEIGAKTFFRERRVSLDGALFHATWSNGPDVMETCLFRRMPGHAVSNGLEFTLNSRWNHTTASMELAYVDAHYTETVMNGNLVVVHDGDALGTPPNVISPWNVTVVYERKFPLHDSDGGFTLRVMDIFHSRNPGPFSTGYPDSKYPAPKLDSDPSNNVLNLRGTFTDRRQRFDLAVYIENALNAQPTLLKRNKGNDVSELFYATTFRPRTVGLSLTTHF